MDIVPRIAAIDTERALFAFGAIVTGALTVLVFRSGNQDQGALFATFSLYLGGAATPVIRDNVTHYKRTGAVALGGVGIVAILTGISSGLPYLFIIGAIAAMFDLF